MYIVADIEAELEVGQGCEPVVVGMYRGILYSGECAYGVSDGGAGTREW